MDDAKLFYLEAQGPDIGNVTAAVCLTCGRHSINGRVDGVGCPECLSFDEEQDSDPES